MPLKIRFNAMPTMGSRSRKSKETGDFANMQTYEQLFCSNLLFAPQLLKARYRSLSEDRLYGLVVDYYRSLEEIRAYRSRQDIHSGVFLGKASPETLEEQRSLLFYANELVFADPITEVRENKQNEVYNRFLGFKDASYRELLAGAVESLMRLKGPLKLGYVSLLPSLKFKQRHEAIPITASRTQFIERVPEQFREFLLPRAIVHECRSIEGGHGVMVMSEPCSTPCGRIAVDFDGDPEYTGLYTLVSVEDVEDVGNRTLRMRQVINDHPSPEEFEAWRTDSIHKTAGRLLYNLAENLERANMAKAYLLTRTQLQADILNKVLGGPETSAEMRIMNSVLDLELPDFQSLSVEQICKLRKNEGAAFRSFRDALATKLREIPIDLDPSEKRRRLQNLGHEITEVQVNAVNNLIGSWKRGLKFDAAGVGIGLLTTCLQSPFGPVGALVAAKQGLDFGKKVADYFGSIKTHPGYFAWKLKRAARVRDRTG